MCNKYEYIDPDYEYIDTKTGILRNRAGITNQQALDFFETATVTKRAKELADNPLPIKDTKSL